MILFFPHLLRENRPEENGGEFLWILKSCGNLSRRTMPLPKKLNVTVEEIRPGYARVSKTVLPDETNPAGTAHGGLFLTLTDIASGSAAAAHGHVAATVSEDYHYLRGALAGDKMTAVAREVKCGRTLCVFEVQITNQDGVLLGVGNCTYFIKDRLLPLE